MILRTLSFYFLSILLILSYSCSSGKKVSKKTVSQSYSNLVFSPDVITKQSLNKIEITITPIDAKRLNGETYAAAKRDGNYEREFASIKEQIEVKIKTASKKDKIWLEGQVNAIDYLTKLAKEDKMPIILVRLLINKIVYGEKGRDGTEIQSLADVDDYPELYNPYKINENYFSVFKISFENTGSEVENVKLKEFQFISGEEQLYPLAANYFENIIEPNSEKIKNVYRMNMPDELIVTLGQKISKYLAIPAINDNYNKLQVQFIREKKVVNFDFNVNKTRTEKVYNLESFDFIYGKNGDPGLRNYFVISYKNNVAYSLKDTRVFVSDEKRMIPASIYAISINPSNSEISFGSNIDFIFNSASKNKIKIDFVKIKKGKRKK